MLPFLIRETAYHFWKFADFTLAALKCLADCLTGTSIVEHPGNPISLALRSPRLLELPECSTMDVPIKQSARHFSAASRKSAKLQK
jgi:hypothetical protein